MRAIARPASMRPSRRLIYPRGERMGDLEALGDAVTGGLAGARRRAWRGRIGPDGQTPKPIASIAGRAIGEFCHACGQHAHVRRTLAPLFHDFLNGLLNFEGKIWRTLPMLAWKPGELTRRYIEGQRASFVRRPRCSCSRVFLMFAAVEATQLEQPRLRSFGRARLPIKSAMDEQKTGARGEAGPKAAKAGRIDPGGSTRG